MIRMVHTLTVIPGVNEQSAVNIRAFSLGVTLSREFRELSSFLKGLFFLDITAVSGTSPTLDVVLQQQDPISLKWGNVTGGNFPQQTAVTGATPLAPLSISLDNTNYRVQFTVGGSATPTVTCSLSCVTGCEESYT